AGHRREQGLGVQDGADLARHGQDLGQLLCGQGSGVRRGGDPAAPSLRGRRIVGPQGGSMVACPFTPMTELRLPLEIDDIKALLPPRHPFLLLDRVLELEPDRRVVGQKNVASDERYFIAGPGGRPTLPASILTEAMAQAGAVLILTKPENRSRLIYFMGIDRVRYPPPGVAGGAGVLEGTVPPPPAKKRAP